MSQQITPGVGVPSWCQEIDNLFLDLDGCVWFGEELAEGARETISRLRDRGKRVAFISNVSSATRSGIAEKLTAMGIPATPEQVQVPLELLPLHPYLREERTTVFALCTQNVREAMRELGISTTDDPRVADVVVVGRDTEMNYRELAAATHALALGARLLALNLDSRVPLENGVIAPGTGAIVAALVEATGVHVELVGKPSKFFFDAALNSFGATRVGTAMVGDTLDSDIQGGIDAGLRTVHVGGSDFSRLPRPPVPDLALSRLAELTYYFG